MAFHPSPLDPSRLPLLVTGVSGVAGYNAFDHLARRYPGRVVGLRPTLTWRLAGDHVVGIDTEDEPSLARLFERHRFRSVLNTTGNCNLKACELAPDLAQRTNVRSAVLVAALARRFGSRLVHLSSDLVFSGTRGGDHAETDPVDPVTVYGKTMAEAEAAVARIEPGAAVLRISLPMGASFNKHAGAIDWIGSRFRAGRPATLYYDEVRSATYCDDLNAVFEHFLATDAAGLFHLGGPRPVTLNQIGQVVNRVGGYEPRLLKGCLRAEAGPVPPRAGDVSMCSAKLIGWLGADPFRPWPCGDELVPTHRGWHAEGPRGSPEQVVRRLYHYPGSCGEEVMRRELAVEQAARARHAVAAGGG